MMNQRTEVGLEREYNKWMRWSFLLLMFLALLTGFGQMPIFKRYYIADIPGFAWLAQFYVTHFLHYLFGTLLLGITGFAGAQWILETRHKQKLSVMGIGRIALLAGILVTGVLLALKNFSGYWYPPSVIVVLNLVHLGLVMIWLGLSLISVLLKCRWIQDG